MKIVNLSQRGRIGLHGGVEVSQPPTPLSCSIVLRTKPDGDCGPRRPDMRVKSI